MTERLPALIVMLSAIFASASDSAYDTPKAPAIATFLLSELSDPSPLPRPVPPPLVLAKSVDSLSLITSTLTVLFEKPFVRPNVPSSASSVLVLVALSGSSSSSSGASSISSASTTSADDCAPD